MKNGPIMGQRWWPTAQTVATTVLYVCACGFTKLLTVGAINERADRPAHLCRLVARAA